jgi:hypothetical protein
MLFMDEQTMTSMHSFSMRCNGETRDVEFDDDGAFIVKKDNVIKERDLTDEQWDDIESAVAYILLWRQV